MRSTGYYFGAFLAMCISLSECRDTRGLRFPSGIMILALMLCEAAGRTSQRSRAIWLSYHWEWIAKAWATAGGQNLKARRSPSQSCISRFLSKMPWQEIYQKVDELQKDLFLREFLDLVKDTHTDDRLATMPLPQYCADGKAREGCLSESTGRAEVDLTLYNVETSSAVAVLPLEDKQGERAGLTEILERQMKNLPKGIITGDAGITSTDITMQITSKGNEYLLQVKGNAGDAFKAIKDLPWENIKHRESVRFKGHGREEIRTIRGLSADFLDEVLELDRYANLGVVYKLESWTLLTKSSRVTYRESYYIGSAALKSFELKTALHMIRNHWKIESLHWRKDVVMGEDACRSKRSGASRILGRLRTFVDFLGQVVAGSVKTFIDNFSAAPRAIAFSS